MIKLLEMEIDRDRRRRVKVFLAEAGRIWNDELDKGSIPAERFCDFSGRYIEIEWLDYACRN